MLMSVLISSHRHIALCTYSLNYESWTLLVGSCASQILHVSTDFNPSRAPSSRDLPCCSLTVLPSGSPDFLAQLTATTSSSSPDVAILCCFLSNIISVSGHLSTYLAKRLSISQSLTLGLDKDVEHTLTAHCVSSLSTAQQFNLVCIQQIIWLSRVRIDSHEHSRVLSPSALSLSLTAGATTVFSCC